MEKQWKMPMDCGFLNDVNYEHPLGKGEVVSSILTGSTRNAHEIRAFVIAPGTYSATQYATKREHDNSGRVKSVESVPATFHDPGPAARRFEAQLAPFIHARPCALCGLPRGSGPVIALGHRFYHPACGRQVDAIRERSR